MRTRRSPTIHRSCLLFYSPVVFPMTGLATSLRLISHQPDSQIYSLTSITNSLWHR